MLREFSKVEQRFLYLIKRSVRWGPPVAQSGLFGGLERIDPTLEAATLFG
jgi:hypothetical protein